jgi:EthD domain
MVLSPGQTDLSYDVFAELVFDDEAAFSAFVAKVTESDATARIAADEELFLDRPKMAIVVIEETKVTPRER